MDISPAQQKFLQANERVDVVAADLSAEDPGVVEKAWERLGGAIGASAAAAEAMSPREKAELIARGEMGSKGASDEVMDLVRDLAGTAGVAP